MLFKLKKESFVRIYKDTGYIVNKFNFADRIMDQSGALFLSALSREPKPIEELVKLIVQNFVDADINEITKDAIDFFTVLENEGFIVSGETEYEIETKDKGFLYSKLLGIPGYQNIALSQPDVDTQTYLVEQFKKNPQLMSFHIELTSRCNERCVHCYIPHENKIHDIDPALFYDVLNQCKEMGVLDITFSGGEPMIHPEFCSFLRKAKKLDFAVGVLTNLTLLNDEIIETLKEGALSSVNVSLYSMNPEIHDSITKLPGSFIKTQAAILKLIDNNIPVQINCPIMKQNKSSFLDVLKWGHEHKCRVLTDYVMMARYDHSTDNLDNRLSPDEVGDVVMDIMNNDIVYQNRVLSPLFQSTSDRDISDDIICGVCITSLAMVANGNIYPCSGWQEYVAGNVSETPLNQIWNDSPKIKYLRSLRRKDFPKCLSCQDKNFCVLCMAHNSNEAPDGDIFKINEHFCKAAAINHKIAVDWKAKQRGKL
ncbi:MAG: radical SAM protein [Treponema sp.]|jgi:radical SAM protein with 4Fe4S-binding SPASM domain|nr:radical SAM protein [Treponema sp.]